VAGRHGQALGDQIDREHVLDAEVEGDPARHLPDGPETDHGERPTRRDLGEHHRLPGGGQDVGQEQEALVRRALRYLDRPEVGLGHAHRLGLGPGHVPVELGVAE
jgi:hypothetical protein